MPALAGREPGGGLKPGLQTDWPVALAMAALAAVALNIVVLAASGI